MQARKKQAAGCQVVSATSVTLSGCGAGEVITSPVTTPKNTGIISVSDRTISLDGVPWVPMVVTKSRSMLPRLTCRREKNSLWQTYSASEYTQTVQFGAHSVHLQVAQTGMAAQALSTPTQS